MKEQLAVPSQAGGGCALAVPLDHLNAASLNAATTFRLSHNGIAATTLHVVLRCAVPCCALRRRAGNIRSHGQDGEDCLHSGAGQQAAWGLVEGRQGLLGVSAREAGVTALIPGTQQPPSHMHAIGL
jgi:hypothetical protein